MNSADGSEITSLSQQMQLKKTLRYFVIILCLVLSSVRSWGQFSYVYIQGDKSTPFYVKMQDEMLPRYGKNYCIISQLLPGTITFQVLFQQNVYPPQTFTVLVPENGYRGFLLAKENDNFALYDLQQKFYIPAFDTITEDHLPGTPGTTVATAKTDIAPVMRTDTAAIVKTDAVTVTNSDTPKPAFIDTATKVIAETSYKPHFIDSMQLNNSRVIQPLTTAPVNDSPISKGIAATIPSPDTIIKNADTIVKPIKPIKDPHLKCSEAMSKEDFDAIFHSTLSTNDDTRGLFLMGKINKCYSTEQVKELLQTLYIESDRYLFCKRIYAHVVDKDNFGTLENMFETNEGKHDFRTIIK